MRCLAAEEGLEPVAHDGALLAREVRPLRRQLLLHTLPLLARRGGQPRLQLEDLEFQAHHLRQQHA